MGLVILGGAVFFVNVIVIILFLYLVQKVANIENEVEYLTRRVKINGAYIKLMTYSSAPPEDLVVLAQTEGLFTKEQMETLKPMVDALKEINARNEIPQAQGEQLT